MREWVSVSNTLILTECGTSQQYNLLKLCFYAGNQSMLRLLKSLADSEICRESFIREVDKLQCEVEDFAKICQRVDGISEEATALITNRQL